MGITNQGLYAAASGGVLGMLQIEVVGNNLANINTVGFKAQRLVSRQQEFADTLTSVIEGQPSRAQGDQERVPGVTGISTITDFTLGPVSHTGNPLNVAVRNPNQFFVIETDKGTSYTRAGNFTLNSEGTIVTQDGFPVMGEGGPLVVPRGTPHITGNGTVLADGRSIGRLKVVEFEDPSALKRTEGVRFQVEIGPDPIPTQADLVPESVEMPNVNVVDSIVQMISAQRSFDAYTKTAKTIDELTGTALKAAQG